MSIVSRTPPHLPDVDEVQREMSNRSSLSGGSPHNPRTMKSFSSAFAMASLDGEFEQKFAGAVRVFAFLHFRQPLELEHTRSVLKERLCAVHRFRSVPIATSSTGMECAFQGLSDGELRKALLEIVRERQDVKTQADLNEFVSELGLKNMEPHYPLWRAWVLNDLADGRHALMLMIDHSIGDGTALIQVLMSVLDPLVGGKPSVATRKKNRPPGCCMQFRGLVKACWGPFIGDQLPGDPPNCLKVKDHRNVSRGKAFCMSDAITMEQIRSVCAILPGSTINDILMTVISLALQDYFRKEEPATLRKKVRGNFPINLRDVQGVDILSEEHFGNRFSQGQLRFPLHIEDPLKVFANVKAQIDLIKVSPEPYVRDKLIKFVVLKSCLGRITIGNLLLDAFGKVTAMLSNVPGPSEQVDFLGQPLDDLSFYVMAPIGVYFGVMQYKGNFKVGIACDVTCEPEPAKLAACWVPAFERLQQAAAAARAQEAVSLSAAFADA